VPGQVFVSEDGGPERLFGHEPQWTAEAPWIRTGSTYDFRLYAGSDRERLLSTVTVTRGSGPSSTAPELWADPNPVPSGPGVGLTTIVWRTGDGSVGYVYVCEDGGDEELFAMKVSGSSDAAWIRSDGVYEFRLYTSGDMSTPVATVTVARGELEGENDSEDDSVEE
jgi:hypothetical protein